MWLGLAVAACKPEEDPHPLWTALDGNWTGEADPGTDELWSMLAVFGWDGERLGGQLALDGFVYPVAGGTDAGGVGAVDAGELALSELTVSGDRAEGWFALDTCDPTARLPACAWEGAFSLDRDP